MLGTANRTDVEQFVSALRKDYEKLSLRIGELSHSVKCECDGVTLRLHFPTIGQGKAKIPELVNAILDYMTTFSLHRTQINAVHEKYGKISPDEFRVLSERLQREAVTLFIQANKATNRNGEAGELLLYLLTEWVLKAPQILAKMALKTNRQMPVHGADGIHVGYEPTSKTLCLYWGESKLHEDVNKAITSAVASIEKALQHESAEHELALVSRHIDATGLPQEAKSALLSFLDPYEGENYNKRMDVTTCLIGFDFDGFSKLDAKSSNEHFKALALPKLRELAPRLSEKLKSAGIEKQLIEIFFFPVPSVKDFRDLFQFKIGWKNDPGSS